jgi:hypothetical protein
MVRCSQSPRLGRNANPPDTSRLPVRSMAATSRRSSSIWTSQAFRSVVLTRSRSRTRTGFGPVMDPGRNTGTVWAVVPVVAVSRPAWHKPRAGQGSTIRIVREGARTGLPVLSTGIATCLRPNSVSLRRRPNGSRRPVGPTTTKSAAPAALKVCHCGHSLRHGSIASPAADACGIPSDDRT